MSSGLIRLLVKTEEALTRFGDVYLPAEQKVYEYILENKVTNLSGTVTELGERFNMSAEYVIAFVDGLNDILPKKYDVRKLDENSQINLDIDFEKLYKKMVEYRADHLYTLPQWNNIFDETKQKALFAEQRNSRTVVKGKKIGKNDPCPCGSGKNINTAVVLIYDNHFEKIDSNNINMDLIEKAAGILRKGGLVAFPTETVYGLGADGLNASACKKIYEAKGRPSDNPLILHIGNISQLKDIVCDIPECAVKIIDRFWPGPVTLVFRKKSIVPDSVSGGLNTVAVRFPSNPVARAIINAAKTPVAAPSANTSGKPSPTRAKHVLHDMDEK